MKRKKVHAFAIRTFVILLIATLALTGCIDEKDRNGVEEQTGTEQTEGAWQMEEVLIKSYYASAMSLNYNRQPLRVYIEYEDRGETDKMELVFVHSAEEAEGYAEGVIVAWPSAKTERILWSLNWFVARDEIDVTEFSLEYPVTMEDLIDRWEAVDELMQSLDRSSFSVITSGI